MTKGVEVDGGKATAHEGVLDSFSMCRKERKRKENEEDKDKDKDAATKWRSE